MAMERPEGPEVELLLLIALERASSARKMLFWRQPKTQSHRHKLAVAGLLIRGSRISLQETGLHHFGENLP